jgi:TolB protein
MIFKVILHLYVLLCTVQALKIEITQGEFRPEPIALPAFAGDGDLKSMGSDILSVVGADLEGCGLFQQVSSALFPQEGELLATKGPQFKEWKATTSARYLLSGKIREEGNKIVVEFRLYDVVAEREIDRGLSFSGEKSKWRRLAHSIADEIYFRIHRETGYFNTQIIFVETVAKGKNPIKTLVRMDQDGENPEKLVNSKGLLLTPRYAPDGKSIAYLDLSKNRAQVYVMDLKTKTRDLLGNFEGMNFAPRFSPDGTQVVMSIEKGGKSAIYLYSVTSKKLTRLTEHRSIDTSPCFSPDGKEIVFTSDRDADGGEQIYIMDIHGGNLRRVTFARGKYSQPVWSSRGDLIAFTKQIEGQFYIGVVNLDGSGERLIAQGYLVEGAEWAKPIPQDRLGSDKARPAARYLVFSKETTSGAPSQIYRVDLTGRHMQLLKTPKDASDCTWSPPLG